MSHVRTVPSCAPLYTVLGRCASSARHETQLSCRVQRSSRSPLCTSHTRIVLSCEPVRSRLPLRIKQNTCAARGRPCSRERVPAAASAAGRRGAHLVLVADELAHAVPPAAPVAQHDDILGAPPHARLLPRGRADARERGGWQAHFAEWRAKRVVQAAPLPELGVPVLPQLVRVADEVEQRPIHVRHRAQRRLVEELHHRLEHLVRHRAQHIGRPSAVERVHHAHRARPAAAGVRGRAGRRGRHGAAGTGAIAASRPAWRNGVHDV